ncbi:MAG: bifunctional demethylmenaquinone methyltransferase/2-methoxy-6-polyprenyl-1,4-benzoquinol methylase UbiE [Alphaproteobacteria bacterium]|nr:bifunctional demethylmenaquinone methyltransferase/2-methoxy-6-polyprenyl-1,4-benzoquinol methylase UbiE [Alphaproteobacteria bacterium]
MSPNPERNWFGEKQVSPEEKTALVRGVFDSVADKYDLMNDLMSGGVHRLWKDRLIRDIRPKADLHYLDVAGGTGDISFRIRKAAGSSARITVCDLDNAMLTVGRDRAVDRGYIDGFTWVTGNAEALPVPDNSVDVYTIAFGLRNVTHIDTALAEAYRVLKPGGRFFCLEFSRVEEPMLAKIYDAFSYGVIPRIGQIVAKDRDSYQYLVESIRKFPPQKQLCRRLEQAGFQGVRHDDLSFGIAAIHRGFKA